jgi:hypothetical protein
MKTKITSLLLLTFFLGFAQPIPQSKKTTAKFFPDKDIEINTPAFQKKKGYTTHQEMMAFLDGLVKKHGELISYSFIGTSQKGKEIPLVRMTNEKSKEKKVRVWLQAGLHGDEPASTEGILYLIDRLLNEEQYAYLLNTIELAIVPMANIDGFEKQNRYAANGLDLNRDQTKLNIPESIILKQAFSNFNAQVAVDFHEYRPYRRDYAQLSDWGVTSANDVMFLYSGNLNVPESLRNYTQERFVNAAKKVMDENGFMHHDYYSSTKVLGEIQLNEGSVNSRSSATSYALTNCVASLIEVRGVGLKRTSLKRRSFITFAIALSYLETTSKNVREVYAEIEKAMLNQSANAFVTSARRVKGEAIKFIDVSKNEYIDIDIIVRDAWYSKPRITRQRPTAYIILPGNEEIVNRLKVLGLGVETTSSEQIIAVEEYIVSAYQKDAEKYEGVNRQTVKTEIQESEKQFPAGSSIVYLNQPKGNLAIEVLEPEAVNSFVSFDVLPAKLNAVLPVFRYLKKEKL